MLHPIRSLLCVIEEGSVNRAARRLGASQPTITRHIQSLEQEFGAPLFERAAWGMRPTDLGFFVRDTFAPLLRDFELARAETQAFARGRHQQLRVGYIGLAAPNFLNPALATLKREFPGVRLTLLDLTPGEQVQRLREGKLDVAIVGQESSRVGDEFFTRRAAVLKVCAVLPSDHPLAVQQRIRLAELSGERFVGVSERAVPGRTKWIVELCAQAGYRPKIAAETENISESFGLVAGEGLVALIPDYREGAAPPGVVYVPLADRWATWSLYVLRQRGRGLAATRRLVEVIGRAA